ncbi:porin family protein [Myxococcota bacterium]|nr:porin family protein [Myxococcota bacterium]MBU1382231.1 porin family protein [Myxococcota bacterium]MBU1495682.1 porin family protein [Myxococcota bacterium]
MIIALSTIFTVYILAFPTPPAKNNIQTPPPISKHAPAAENGSTKNVPEKTSPALPEKNPVGESSTDKRTTRNDEGQQQVEIFVGCLDSNNENYKLEKCFLYRNQITEKDKWKFCKIESVKNRMKGFCKKLQLKHSRIKFFNRYPAGKRSLLLGSCYIKRIKQYSSEQCVTFRKSVMKLEISPIPFCFYKSSGEYYSADCKEHRKIVYRSLRAEEEPYEGEVNEAPRAKAPLIKPSTPNPGKSNKNWFFSISMNTPFCQGSDCTQDEFVFKNGAGIGFSIFYLFPNNFALGLSLDVYSILAKDDNDKAIDEIDFSLSAFMLEARYYIPTSTNFKIFGLFGVGMVHYTIKVDLGSITGEAEDSGKGFRIGAGFEYAFGPTFSMGMAFYYQGQYWDEGEKAALFEEHDINLFNIGAHLIWHF